MDIKNNMLMVPNAPRPFTEVPKSFRNFSISNGLQKSRTTVNKLMARPGVFNRSLNSFMKGGFGKYVLGAGMNAFLVTAGWAVAGTAFGVGKQITQSMSFRRMEPPGGVGFGSGYISWSKTNGMPADHLSTNGLSLSLSNMRHTSVI